jgi:hypothetical protein
MRWLRVWLPLAIVAAGVVVIVATGGSEVGWEGGVGIIGAGASVWLLNVIFRVGVQGEHDRDAEDAARAYYDEHGYWPDEAPPGAASDAPESPPARADRRTDPHRPPRHPERPPGRPGGPARRPPRRP